MKLKSEELLNQLKSVTEENLNFVISLKSLSEPELNRRISENSWSILECLQHLNLYGNFYLKEISEKINQSRLKNSEVFKSGILGNYFAKSMLPKENLNKMKTFKSMNPIYSELSKNVIDTFINQQKELLTLLETAKSKNLTKIKTNISISKLIKLRLGDTFRFLIYHNLRHMEQIKNILKS